MIAPNGFTPAAKTRAEKAGVDLFRPVDTGEHHGRPTLPYRRYACSQSSQNLAYLSRGLVTVLFQQMYIREI